MNKHQLFTGLLLLLAFGSQAQNVTATSGGEGSVGGMNVDYTVGEVFITTHQNGNSILTQGFHQPYYTIVAVIENFPVGTLKVSPNPTTSILQVQFEQINLESIFISLSDITGKVIKTSRVTAQIWETDLSSYESGLYLLNVTDRKSHKSNSFKIFKSH